MSDAPISENLPSSRAYPWPDEQLPYVEDRADWLALYGMGHPMWDMVEAFPQLLPRRTLPTPIPTTCVLLRSTVEVVLACTNESPA